MRRQWQTDDETMHLHLHLGNLAMKDIGIQGGSIADRRAARRAAMPVTTALLAEFAEWGATVVYACERGITVGKMPDYSGAFDIPPGYAPMRQVRAKVGGEKK